VHGPVVTAPIRCLFSMLVANFSALTALPNMEG